MDIAVEINYYQLGRIHYAQEIVVAPPGITAIERMQWEQGWADCARETKVELETWEDDGGPCREGD